ncbi:hypothetical protein EG329_013985 [Mollisiaceae sp. DMI_Dod_QoI]|nr:hypothetical protein EG329_013985 [Helotiales sp. DMI_Dod_QoI]
MASDPIFVVLKHTAWLDASQFESRILGSIIKEFRRPTDRYEPAQDTTALDYYDASQFPFIEGSLTNFHASPANNSNNSLSISLGDIAGFRFGGSKKDEMHLKGDVIRWKRLQQHELFLRNLIANQRVCKEVPKWISLVNIHPPTLVVGIMMCENTMVDVVVERTRTTEVKFTVPVAAVAAGAAGAPGLEQVLGVDGVVDPGVEVAREMKTVQNVGGKTTTKGQIFALELRKVTTEWMSKTLKMGGSLKPKGKLLTDRNGGAKVVPEMRAEDFIVEEFTEEELKEIEAYM